MMEATKNFECRRCGNCCAIAGTVRINRGEELAIADYLSIPVAEFTERYTDLLPSRLGLKLKDASDGSCIFLGDDRLCRINLVKPDQCRGFPMKWKYDDWKKVCSANYASAIELD